MIFFPGSERRDKISEPSPAPPAQHPRCSSAPCREINGLFVFGGTLSNKHTINHPRLPGRLLSEPRQLRSFQIPGARTAWCSLTHRAGCFPQLSLPCSKNAFSNHAAAFVLYFLPPKWVRYGGFVCTWRSGF